MTDHVSTVETIPVNFAIGEAIEGAVAKSEAWAAALVVTNDAQLTDAAQGLRDITTTAKKIEAARVNRKAPLLEATRRLDGTFKPVLDRLKIIERDTKQKISQYQAAVAAAKAEEARAKREAAEAEQARQRAIAEEARKRNDIEAAANATFAAEMSVPPPMPAPTKAPGLVETSRWSAEVTDLSLLIVACANDPERYLDLLLPNMPALNRLAVSHHGAVQVPGVKMVETKSVSVRS